MVTDSKLTRGRTRAMSAFKKKSFWLIKCIFKITIYHKYPQSKLSKKGLFWYFEAESSLQGLVWLKKNGHSLLRGCLDGFFYHSIYITHHFKIPHPFGTITHLLSLNIFHTVCGPHTCYSMHFFFLVPIAQKPEPSEIKKIKIKTQITRTQ